MDVPLENYMYRYYEPCFYIDLHLQFRGQKLNSILRKTLIMSAQYQKEPSLKEIQYAVSYLQVYMALGGRPSLGAILLHLYLGRVT